MEGLGSGECGGELKERGRAVGDGEVWSDFCEGDDDEGALGDARVRDLEVIEMEGEVAVEEDVNIEGARGVFRSAGGASEFGFELLEPEEDVGRG